MIAAHQRQADAAQQLVPKPMPPPPPVPVRLPRAPPLRKRRVLVDIPGAGSAAILETMMGKIVRDSSIHSRSDALEARHSYYLRATSLSKPHVDHVCECQFLGHAIVQSPSFARGGGSSILRALDVEHAYNEGHTGLKTQGPAVQVALRPLYDIQVRRVDLPI